MSLMANYPHELRELERQIRNYAAICGVEAENARELDEVIHDRNATGTRETLRALLILRLKVEAGMMDVGFTPHSELPEENL